MANLSNKSIPLLISKLKTAIMTSQRARGGVEMWRRREEIKDELVMRGEGALVPLVHMLENTDEDAASHAADVIGRINSAEAVVTLAKLLAGASPPHTKRAAARALNLMETPDAVLALNLWQGRLQKTRQHLQAFIQEGNAPPPVVAALQTLAREHRATPEQVADAYLLLTTDETLSLDARARLHLLPLSPAECATLEDAANPSST